MRVTRYTNSLATNFFCFALVAGFASSSVALSPLLPLALTALIHAGHGQPSPNQPLPLLPPMFGITAQLSPTMGAASRG